MTSLVSILIPMYNAEAYITETLESCLAQSYPNIEIIVVDDGSSDNGLQIAEVYADNYDNIFVYTQLNSGAPRARNHAFEKAKGEYIQYLDADDLLSGNKIASQMVLAAQYGYDPNIIFTSKFSYFTESVSDAVYFKQRIDHSYQSGMDWLVDAWSGGGFGVVMGWLTHRKLIENAGCWNEDLKKNQDGEFFSRIVVKTQKVLMCEDVMVYYRRTGNTSISSQFKESVAVSTLESLKLYEENVKGTIVHSGLQKALAYNYLGFISNYYPHFPHLLKEAENHIIRLGFNFRTLESPGKLGALARIIGSNNIIKLRYLQRKIVQ